MTYPEDVMKAAKKIARETASNETRMSIAARAILAERERAAKKAGPKGPRPCDCEPLGCYCSNPGSAQEVAAWDEATALATAIRKGEAS